MCFNKDYKKNAIYSADVLNLNVISNPAKLLETPTNWHLNNLFFLKKNLGYIAATPPDSSLAPTQQHYHYLT